jgi:hypothetical protein
MGVGKHCDSKWWLRAERYKLKVQLIDFLELFCINFHTFTSIHLPVSPHQVGQPLCNLTTPEAYISRNKSHFTIHIVIKSRALLPMDALVGSQGAAKIAKTPVSNNRISLHGHKVSFETLLTLLTYMIAR